jgi:hypothetical protein
MITASRWCSVRHAGAFTTVFQTTVTFVKLGGGIDGVTNRPLSVILKNGNASIKQHIPHTSNKFISYKEI